MKHLSLALLTMTAMCLPVPAITAVGSFIDPGEMEVAGIEQLNSEVALIGRISQGILLSITRCEIDEICLGHVNRTEVQQMIDAIAARVQLLTERREATGEQGLEDVLIAYVEQRENLSTYLDKINTLVPAESVNNDFFGITSTNVISISEQYSIFNDVDEGLEDEEFMIDEEVEQQGSESTAEQIAE